MKYISSIEASKRWGISERTVRNYCQNGRVNNAILVGKKWLIPDNASKPFRKTRISKKTNSLIKRLKEERDTNLKGGIYHRIQVDFTYNSNHIEGSKLTYDQTRFIFETNTIGFDKTAVNVDDIIETANHFRCVDFIIDNINKQLSESFIKTLHSMLKSGTSDSRKSWFNVGKYKLIENEVGNRETTSPELVSYEMKKLLKMYNAVGKKNFEDIIDFHYHFESIHPFQDGNGRVGRLIMFKECLKNSLVPFIIDDDYKAFYYRGLKEWKKEKGYLLDTCLSAQDKFKQYLDYFNITY